MVRLFGKKHDLLALNLVGFILSIPIYFGCAYIMTAPLVNALQKISKKSMKGYVIAIFTGLMLTHSCVAPPPGPLAVAGQIGANVGWFIIWGIVICLPASLIVGWLYANFVVSKEEKKAQHEAMQELMDDKELLAPDPNKPSALKAFLLVIFPIVLIVFASIFSLFVKEGAVYNVVNFIGNSNIALFLAMVVTGFVLHKYMPGKTVMQYIDEFADRTGNILLIVGAGGCFASMLGATTMSTDLVAIMSATNMPVILLGFLLAFCIRAAVGSATAAMLTSIAIAGPVCLAAGMSPIVAGLSVCLGANAATFPTDVTFWFPSTYNGLNTKDCLMTTTVPCILSGVLGMIVLAVLNAFAGVLPGMF